MGDEATVAVDSVVVGNAKIDCAVKAATATDLKLTMVLTRRRSCSYD